MSMKIELEISELEAAEAITERSTNPIEALADTEYLKDRKLVRVVIKYGGALKIIESQFSKSNAHSRFFAYNSIFTKFAEFIGGEMKKDTSSI